MKRLQVLMTILVFGMFPMEIFCGDVPSVDKACCVDTACSIETEETCDGIYYEGFSCLANGCPCDHENRFLCFRWSWLGKFTVAEHFRISALYHWNLCMTGPGNYQELSGCIGRFDLDDANGDGILDTYDGDKDIDLYDYAELMVLISEFEE